MTRLLTWLGTTVPRHPWRFVLGTVIPCLLLAGVAVVTPKDLGFSSILDLDDPTVARFADINDALNLSGRSLLLIEGDDDEELARAAAAIAEGLDGLPEVAWAVGSFPRDWVEANAPWFVDRDVFDAWLGVATRPSDLDGARDLRARRDAFEGDADPLSAPGLRAVVVQMTGDALTVEVGGGDFVVIDAAMEELAAPFAVETTWAGMAAAAGEDQANVLSRITILTPVSLILVLLILRLAERRLTRLAAVAAPMILAAVGTLGVVGLVLGKITQGEAFFGVLVMGLGIDFGLHLFVRLRNEQAAGKTFEEAMVVTLVGTGRGVAAGAATTAGAFYVAAVADDPMIRHFGFSAGTGLVLCLTLMLTLLPAVQTLLHRREEAPAPAVHLRFGFVDAVAAWAVAHPRISVAVSFVAVAGALAGAPRFHYETDLAKVFTRDVEAIDGMTRAAERLETTPAPWIVLADDLADARAVEAGFDDVEGYATASAASLFRADTSERVAALEAGRDALDAQIRRYTGLSLLGGSGGLAGGGTGAAAADVRDALKVLAAARDAGPPSLDDLPDALARELIAPDGRLIVMIQPPKPTMDGAVAKEERLVIHAVDERAASFNQLFELTMAADRPWLRNVAYGICVFVLLLLFVDLRRPRDVLLALSPVAVGAGVTFGVMCWAGVAFNPLTMLVVPLLVGLGVDDGIHVVHRFREEPHRPVDEAASAVGTAIVLTTLTTSASFGVLAFSNHVGMESMALAMCAGLPLCLLASIVLVPALHTLLPGGGAPDGE